MENFTSFSAFQQQLRDAQDAEKGTGGPSGAGREEANRPGVSPENLQEMHDYLTEQVRKMDVVHSYVDGTGDYIDCVKVESQPGLQGVGQIAKPPASATDTGLGYPTRDDAHEAAPAVDRFGNVMRCPEGCIPVRRVSLDELSRAGSLQNYFQKAPGGGMVPPGVV
jgi:hypothetical protein